MIFLLFFVVRLLTVRVSLWLPSDPDATYELAKFGPSQKAKVQENLGFKSDTAVFPFFSLSLLPSFFAFLPFFFFPFAGHFVGFISLGKVFSKAFR